MNEYPETVEHEELDNASIGLEKATQILEEFRKRYPGIKDSEILNMVTALKNKRARENAQNTPKHELRVPDWDSSRHLKLTNHAQIDENRYVLNLNRIASGGEGDIFEVYDAVLDKILIAKQAKREWETERIEQEAKVLAQLGVETRGVPTVYAVVKEDETNWVLMDKIEGLDLTKHLIAHAITEEDCLRICNKITHTLAVAEDMGIMHRDIKPENIIINEQGDPIIIDFGMSTGVADGELIPGSVGYRAPELERGEMPSQRSEVYSIGKLLQFIISDMPESKTKQALRDISYKAAAGKQDNRYESIAALLQDIQSIKS